MSVPNFMASLAKNKMLSIQMKYTMSYIMEVLGPTCSELVGPFG